MSKERKIELTADEKERLRKFTGLFSQMDTNSSTHTFIGEYSISARKNRFEEDLTMTIRRCNDEPIKYPVSERNAEMELTQHIEIDRGFNRDLRELDSFTKEAAERKEEKHEYTVEALNGIYSVSLEPDKEHEGQFMAEVVRNDGKILLMKNIEEKETAEVIREVIKRDFTREMTDRITFPEEPEKKMNVVMDKMDSLDLNSSQLAVDVDGDGTIDVDVIVSNDDELITDIRDCEPTAPFKESFEETVRAAVQRHEEMKTAPGNNNERTASVSRDDSGEMERTRI